MDKTTQLIYMGYAEEFPGQDQIDGIDEALDTGLRSVPGQAVSRSPGSAVSTPSLNT